MIFMLARSMCCCLCSTTMRAAQLPAGKFCGTAAASSFLSGGDPNSEKGTPRIACLPRNAADGENFSNDHPSAGRQPAPADNPPQSFHPSRGGTIPVPPPDAECVRPTLLTLLVIGPNGLHRHVRIIRGEAGHAQIHQPMKNFGVPLFPRQRLE